MEMKGILLMAYGGPASLDQVETYYTHIRGGRRPSGGELNDLLNRYRAIGGASPLLEITKRQAAGLEKVIRAAGKEVKVYAGMKHSDPFIGETVRRAASEGVTSLLCVALAPHYSSISIGGYQKAVTEASSALKGKMEVVFVPSWHRNRGMLSMWAGRVSEATRKAGQDASVVFSAHSLPERILREGDPYKDQLLESSRLISDLAGLRDWTFAFQSQSRTGEPWLGPDILDRLQSLHRGGKSNFVLAPIGFVSDHLEILYDLDVECRGWADKAGARLTRCPSPNDSAEMVAALRDIAADNGFA